MIIFPKGGAGPHNNRVSLSIHRENGNRTSVGWQDRNERQAQTDTLQARAVTEKVRHVCMDSDATNSLFL